MREFRMQGSRGQTKTWRIAVKGDELHTEWGVLGGRKQSTIDVIPAVFVGKSNELSPEANAIEEVKRRIKKKTDEGYVEYRDGSAVGADPASGFDDKIWAQGLPKQFCGYKPKPQPTEKDAKSWSQLQETLESGNAIITVKEDGFKHWVLVTATGGVKIYTSGMDECTDKFPHLVQSFASKTSAIPPRSLLCCEFTVRLGDNTCDRLAMQAISNSLPQRARSIQQDPTQKTIATVLSVVFWDGTDVFSDFSFGQIIEFMEEQFGVPSRCPPYIRGMEVFYEPLDAARDYVKRRGVEGLVIYDSRARPGKRAYNFRGKPERPQCWKWKPSFEDDFVVVFDPDGAHGFAKGEGGAWGRGKHRGAAGRIALYQYDAEAFLVYCSGCGSGLTDEERVAITKGTKLGICGVAEIKYTSRRYYKRGEGSNALVEPIFVRWRHDKGARDCVNPQL